MNLKVLFFAGYKERFGEERRVSLGDGATAGDLAAALGLEGPLLIAVNETLVEAGAALRDSDTVAFMAPFSGGA